ncbi:MAG: NTP transferase domain-containing protein [Candidatus Saccharimonadales bacterium]
MGEKLFGLVLAGGKSRRLGEDKGLINWHGKKQRYYLADLLNRHCQDTYISCRQDQAKEIQDLNYRTILDNFAGVDGPYGALISAMKEYAKASWLVVACDLPFFDDEAAETLIRNRDPNFIATAYKSPANGLPEPLAAIWEPASLQILLESFKTDAISCPRKALIKSANIVKLIDPKLPSTVVNVNTPADMIQAQELIGVK